MGSHYQIIGTGFNFLIKYITCEDVLYVQEVVTHFIYYMSMKKWCSDIYCLGHWREDGQRKRERGGQGDLRFKDGSRGGNLYSIEMSKGVPKGPRREIILKSYVMFLVPAIYLINWSIDTTANLTHILQLWGEGGFLAIRIFPPHRFYFIYTFFKFKDSAYQGS